VIGELSFGHATLIQQALTILHAYLVAARIIFVRIYMAPLFSQHNQLNKRIYLV
jgi:hypothetical protein